MPGEVDLLLAEERKHLGMHGRPNAATNWYASTVHDDAYKDAAWCDMYQSWCAHNVGLTDKVGHFAYCPSHVNWFKSRKQWGHLPRKGAVVFFDWDHDGVADHVGLVEAVNADRTITTLEGNTGDAVKRKVRSPGVVLGYGYPAYTSASPKPSNLHPYPGHESRRGSTGSNVMSIQKALNSHGAHLSVDGIFGSRTESAVKAFQKDHHLQVDGVVGPKTWGALFK